MSHGSTIPRGFALASAALLGLLATACGDPENTDAQQAARCGEPGSWPIVSASGANNGGVLGLADGYVVAWSQTTGEPKRLHAADACGEGAVEIALADELEGNGTVVLAGPHVVVLADASTHRFDPASGSTHQLSGPVFAEMHDTPHGLLSLGIGGKLRLHPNPADPATEAVLLHDGAAWLPRAENLDPPPWPHLWTDGQQTFALSTSFDLLRIDLTAAEGTEHPIELPEVQEFHILDGGNAVAWRGLNGDMLTVTDLGDDSELFATPQGDTNWNVQEAGSWALITTERGRLLNLDSGAIIEPVDFDPVELHPTGTDRVLIVGYPNGSLARGYWLIDSAGELSSFLAPDACLDFDSQVTPSGVVIPDGPCEPQTALYNPLDVMTLQPFAGGGAQTLGERFGFAYSVFEGDWIVSWDEDVGTGKGSLSADSPRTDPAHMAEEVTIAPPVTDGLDVYYFELGRGVQRFTLAE